jgi:hypothetical protein
VSTQVEPDEVRKIEELTNDVVPHMGEMSEAQFLDLMQERASVAREDGTDRWHRRSVVSADAARIQPFEVRPRVVALQRVIYQAGAR